MVGKMRLICYPFKTIVFFIFLSVIIINDCYGQSYGLGFSSFEVVQDKRTSLDLSPARDLTFKHNFELSFEMSFIPNYPTYFGYIVRIVENGQRNIDLVYNTQAPKKPFSVIIGEKLSAISFDIDTNKLFNQWNKLKLEFDVDNNRIILHAGKKLFIEKNILLKKNTSYKILFGVNNYGQFQTTDIPPMKLRDVRIAENGNLKYNWPLNEEKGLIAHEIVNQNDGAVVNPQWMTAMHHDWQLVQNLTVNGVASVAFNAQKETLYIISTDSLYSYSARRLRWNSSAYSNGNLILTPGGQSIYNPFDSTLYNFFPDQKFLARYNFNTHSWDKKFLLGPSTNYWHANKFFSDEDTSLYLIGGYGHLYYRNVVQQSNLNSLKWQTVPVSGDFFMPRYLSALGTTANGDTAYILGGYGNRNGEQILNPRNIYDMMRFTVKNKSFKKLFELKVKNEGFAFANSLVIDEKDKTYYGLIFSQHKFNSDLQLLTGSLSNPSYKLSGGSIPYSFQDVRSFADLYYCPTSKKFIAVTLLRDGTKQTRISVYSLLSPPYGQPQQITAVKNINWYVIAGSVFIISVSLVLFFRRKTAKELRPPSVQRPGHQILTGRIPVQAEIHKETKIFNSNSHLKNAILLFGHLQVFDAEGNEITKQFTPLIKELFLMILLHSIRWGRGLSSEKLNEILWFDKDAKSATNNRSVNIAKLKNVLDKMKHCHLSKETGYWKIDIDYNLIYVDYHSYLNIVKDKEGLDIYKIKNLSSIVQRGNLLSNIEHEWLDPFKSEISNEVIDTYLHFAQSDEISNDQELLIELSNFIFYFDPVNEDAMVMKCKALSFLGKHSLAKNTFENFTKEYKTIYGEEFKKDFHAILE
jgi:two-component SAPR family response regulator